LGSWRNKFVSLGRRVALIILVLASILIILLSFLKTPTKVWKRLVEFQRRFYWGGGVAKLNKKIPCVKWEVICKPKEEGGLGIKDLKIFDLPLLGK
jgi:hypothetical protein